MIISTLSEHVFLRFLPHFGDENWPFYEYIKNPPIGFLIIGIFIEVIKAFKMTHISKLLFFKYTGVHI